MRREAHLLWVVPVLVVCIAEGALAQSKSLSICSYQPPGEARALDFTNVVPVSVELALSSDDVRQAVDDLTSTAGHPLTAADLEKQWLKMQAALGELVTDIDKMEPPTTDQEILQLKSQANYLISFLSVPDNLLHLSRVTHQFNFEVLDGMMLKPGYWRTGTSTLSSSCSYATTTIAGGSVAVQLATRSVNNEYVTLRQRMDSIYAASKRLLGVCLPQITFARYFVLGGNSRVTFSSEVKALEALDKLKSGAIDKSLDVTGHTLVGFSPSWNFGEVVLNGWWFSGLASSVLMCPP